MKTSTILLIVAFVAATAAGCIPVHKVSYTNQCNVDIDVYADDHPHPAVLGLSPGQTANGVRGAQEGQRFFEARNESDTIIDSQQIDVKGALQVTFCR